MEAQPTPLADSLAALRAAAQADDAYGWLPASLHALIMACLARLFGRLEQIALLWQAGQLPSLAPPSLAPRAVRRIPTTRTPGNANLRRAAYPRAVSPLPAWPLPELPVPELPVPELSLGSSSALARLLLGRVLPPPARCPLSPPNRYRDHRKHRYRRDSTVGMALTTAI